MYIPSSFAIEDRATLVAFMEEYSFATIVSLDEGQLFATSLPLLLRADGETVTIAGHLARANQHWRHWDGLTEALVLFQGPHAYVSPKCYVAKEAVPTWNYTAVHAWGRPRVILETDWLLELVLTLTSKHEKKEEHPWTPPPEAGYLDRMIGGIVGFEIPVVRIEGKFKLGQNRPQEDQQKMIRLFGASDNPAERALAEMLIQQSQAV